MDRDPGETPADSLLSVDVSLDSGIGLIALDGELDLSTASKLHTQLAAIHHERPRKVFIDTSGLRFAGVTGLTALAEEIEAFEVRHTEVHIVGLRPEVRRVAEFLGLAQPTTDSPGMDGP